MDRAFPRSSEEEPWKRKTSKEVTMGGKSIPGSGDSEAKAPWLDAVQKGEGERSAFMLCRAAPRA